MHYKRVMLFSARGSAPWYGVMWADESDLMEVIEFL